MTPANSIQQLADMGLERVSLACGNFDGVHLGHQAIFARAVQRAQESDATPIVLTFDPHPRAFFRPDDPPSLILTMAHRLALLPRYGINHAVVLEFTRELAQLAPQAFIEALIDGPVEVTAVCVGKRWRFGHRAAGDTELLSRLGEQRNFVVDAVPEICDDQGPVSSTRIRDCLRNADLPGVQALLGRPYSVRGEVVRGRGYAGKNFGIPTANVACNGELVPPLGVYKAVATIDNGPARPAVCYLGESPTLLEDGEIASVEVHFYDLEENLYDRTVEVSFLEFVRPDQKFDDFDTLKTHVLGDVAQVRELHAR
jgi:riboflavin kinase/FMN adenylyltransferase